MELIKDKWTKKDGVEFTKYLETFKNIEKIEWSKGILNTEMLVLALKTQTIKDITKDIRKGNYFSFLDLELNDYYENSAINGYLIAQIENFKTMEKYLNRYILTIDNWASCDLLSFDVKNREKEFYALALRYVKDDKPFVKRIGLNILFKLISYDEYIDHIFSIMNSFYEETHYYVNMMNAWLFCECFIKRREETITFLKHHKLNKFTINKGISKCRDSYRVSKEDKEMLIQYRVK
ncbi:MAG: DNA alkylation repair protein [Bacilli bacterium]|nr:DNA alkylation repair protein [Bacilli bacterium]MDD4809153.1 DNA alkylation repair protein [Bacilli bacterium]